MVHCEIKSWSKEYTDLVVITEAPIVIPYLLSHSNSFQKTCDWPKWKRPGGEPTYGNSLRSSDT